MNHPRARWLLFLGPLILQACRAPTDFVAPPEHVAFVDGKVAHFDSLEATLEMYNFSWFPRDETFTHIPNTTFVTVRITVENRSSVAMRMAVESFLWRTLLIGRPGEGPLWPAIHGGRTPRLVSGTLLPGESVEGWLTFPVPADEHGDELVWRPTSGVTLAIPVPLSLGSPPFFHRCLVFGRITDPDGHAVAEAEVELTVRRETCEGTLVGATSLQSDASGWYFVPFQTPDGDPLCVDVLVTPPIGSDLTSARVRDRTIYPAQPTPDREPPELRVDVTLPRR